MRQNRKCWLGTKNFVGTVVRKKHKVCWFFVTFAHIFNMNIFFPSNTNIIYCYKFTCK